MPINRKNMKLPTLPATLHAADVLNAPDRDEFVEQSKMKRPVRRFDEKKGKVVTLAERAARAYIMPTLQPDRARKKRPLTAPRKFLKKISTFRPLSSPFEYEESGMFELNSGAGLISGDVINDLFVYPDLFTS